MSAGPAVVVERSTSPPGPWREFWGAFSANRGAVIGLSVIVLLLLVALFAPWIAPHAPNQTDSTAFLLPPAWQEGGSAKHLLGTDAIGRDILSRLMFGARLSLSIGVAVVAISAAVGIALGLVAGFFRGVFEIAIMQIGRAHV